MLETTMLQESDSSTRSCRCCGRGSKGGNGDGNCCWGVAAVGCEGGFERDMLSGALGGQEGGVTGNALGGVKGGIPGSSHPRCYLALVCLIM